MPDRPTAFSDKIRSLAEAALKGARSQNIKEVEDCFKRAEILHNAKRPGCTKDELRVFQTAYERCKEGEWEKAANLLDASLKAKGGG